MKTIKIIMMILGNVVLVLLHRHLIEVGGFSILHFLEFVSLHALWTIITMKDVYIRI
jgi:hypothetical protein